MHMASSSSERVYIEYFLGRRMSGSYEQGGALPPLGVL
jgi:hypothetical protein